MNILHISRRFYPFIGGTEKYIYEISKRLVKRNINCRVLTLNYDILDKKQKLNNYDTIEGIEIFRIPGFGYYKKPIPLKIPINLFKWANIVHLHDIRFLYETTLFFKPIFKYKIVLSTHGFVLHTKDLQIIKNFLIPFYYKLTIVNFIDSVICVSKQDFEYFKNIIKKNLYLIENGVDFGKFSKIKKNSKKGKFLYFGRIDKNKGIDLLFRSLSLLSDEDWQLDVVGSGSVELIKNLKDLADRLGISKKINWWGYLDEEKLFQFLSEAYICFFSSTYEGFGFTLIEAMAGGCVCVTNSIQAYKDIVDNKINGFLINFSESQTAAEIIKMLLNSDNKRFSSISENAKEKAKKFDWENKIEQIIKTYNNIMIF
jgi:alpha-1,3-mannosyltransferase